MARASVKDMQMATGRHPVGDWLSQMFDYVTAADRVGSDRL